MRMLTSATQALARRHHHHRAGGVVNGEVPYKIPRVTCAPYDYRDELVRSKVATAIEQGLRDPSLIAVNVATELFGEHPEHFVVVFPPAPWARAEVKCVFDHVLRAVDEAFVERELDPNDVVTRPVEWKAVRGGRSPDLRDYPWNDAVIDIDGVPTPGTFHLCSDTDTDHEVFQRLLQRALEMAGMDTAMATDPTSKVARRLRAELRAETLRSPWNDKRLTSSSATLAGGRDPKTNGAEDAGIVHVIGPYGRGLVWAARHQDDMDRLQRGLPAKRGVDLDGRKIGSGASQMLIWFPAINLERLRGSAPVATTQGMGWSDTGKNTIHPPTVIDQLGVEMSGVQLAGGFLETEAIS